MNDLETPPQPLGRADAVWVLVLVVTAIVTGIPILRGGYLTYLDNAVHVAEIASLATTRTGWSEVGFAGLPLDTLHSPLFYGGLSTLVRWGMPPGPLYCLCLFLGFVTPALVVYLIGRRALPLVPAAALSYAVLIMRPAIVGTESALGGMWTAMLALSGVLLVLDQIARPRRTRMSWLVVATLIGVVGLTHLFAVLVLVIVFLVHAGLVLGHRPAPFRMLLIDGTAFVVGALASARYWLSLFTEQTASNILPQNLGIPQLVDMFFFGADFLFLQGPELVSSRMVFTDKLPAFAILVLGLLAIRTVRGKELGLTHYGLALAGVLGLCLVIIAESHVTVFGPVSWRLMRYMHFGLALASISTLAELARLRAFRPALQTPSLATLAVAGGIAAGLGSWWGWPLRFVVTSDASEDREMADVRALFRWVRDNRRPDWGRVYTQDTFYMESPLSRLAKSHVLALLAMESGAEQVGTYYGIVPWKTRWTLSEFNTVLGARVLDQRGIDDRAGLFDDINVSAVVLSSPAGATLFEQHPSYRRLFSAGRFAVFERIRGKGRPWARSSAASAVVRVLERTPGILRLAVTCPPEGCVVWTHASWHPSWRLIGPPGATLEQTRHGLSFVAGIPQGAHELTLEYRTSRLPLTLTVLGWLGLVAAWIATWWAGRGARPPSP